MDLKVEKRDILGKKVDALRQGGFLPAELYGHDMPNLHLSVNTKDFEKIYKAAGKNTIINVITDGAPKPALIYNVQRHPVSGDIESVDLYAVRMDEEITAKVPIVFTGESTAVKAGLGVLIESMDEIEVEALPSDIPHEITVDISSLKEVGDSIYVKDIVVAGKFKFNIDPENVIVSISGLAHEEEAVATEITPDQVVVETEEKKAERDAAKSAAGDDSKA
jgi:large subunit ribosomal protein L25